MYISEEVSLIFLSLEIQWDISLNIKSIFLLIEGGLCVVFQLLLASSSSSPEGTGDSVSTLGASCFTLLSSTGGTNKIYHRVKREKVEKVC